MKSKIITKSSTTGVEDALNEFLVTITENQIIEVKFQTSAGGPGTPVLYSVVIIYREIITGEFKVVNN